MTESTQVIYSKAITNEEIKVSDAAKQQMAVLLAEADDDASAIRIFITGGGCGGLNYGMTYADQAGEFDKVMSTEGLKLVVDAVAINYLSGCDIDYVKQGANETFVFNNVFQQIGGSGQCGGCGGGM